MNTRRHLSILLATLCTLTASSSLTLFAAPANPTPLADAITAFNKAASLDPIGKSQSPLTEAEVIAAILMYEKPADAPVSNHLLQTFKAIAASGELPPNATFESLNGYDRGGAHIFDVWSVRIRLEREDRSSYAFLIRERVIGSRTLEDELERVHQRIVNSRAELMVGGYRLLNRRDDLRARIEKLQKATVANPQ